MIRLTEDKLAYIAGIVDGEGTFSARNTQNRNSFPPVVSVRLIVWNTSLELLNWFQKQIGGHLSSVRNLKDGENRKPIYCWYIGSKKEILELLVQIYPYLIVKKKVGKKMMEFCERKLSLCRHIRSENEIKQDLFFKSQLNKLNMRGGVGLSFV